MTNYFIPQSEKIDLKDSKSASDILFELSTILEDETYKNKKIRIDLGAVILDQAQLLSIKSLIQSVNSEMISIFTDSPKTELAALNTGIIVANLDEEESPESADVEQPTPVVEDKQEECQPEFQEEITQEFVEPKVEVQETAPKEEYDFSKALENILEEENEVESKELDELEKAETLYIKRTLRSGQTASFDGNVIVIGDSHPGSEIVASGDITVWGVLSGIAHAGAKGNENARVRALKLNAIQLRIAGYFSRRPDVGEVVFSPKDGGFRPEEARVANGMVTIYTTSI